MLQLLVKSVLLYAAEAWGPGVKHSLGLCRMCRYRQKESFESGEPSISLPTVYVYKMGMLPLKWEASKRIVDIWVQVMRMNDNRLGKGLMLEALKP